jgi:hypothetical protein
MYEILVHKKNLQYEVFIFIYQQIFLLIFANRYECFFLSLALAFPELLFCLYT